MASAGNIRAGGAYVEIFAKDGAFQQALTRVQNKMKAVGTAMRSVGSSMTIGSAAMGAPMVLALRQFTAFDDAIRMTGAVSQATGPQLQQLTDKARELGASTSFTAAQVALLMGELGRAGFSPDQIEDMTGAVLDLSRATGTDATLSAGIMASTIRQFGMEAGSAVRVADVLTAAANKTFNSVEGLGEAMQYAGPVAASMGMDLEQTAAILGTLGNVGIQGSEAGTALRRLLTITGAEAQKLQEIFGVAFLDASGNVRPLVDTLGEVAQATNGLSSGERVKKFNDAFGLLGITAAGAIGSVAADTRALEADLRKAGGTARTTAQQMDAGLGGSLRILMSAIEGVSLAFGDALAPALQVLARGGQAVANAFRQFLTDFPAVAQIAAGAVGGFFALGVALTATGFAIQLAARGLGVFGVALRIIPALFTPVGASLALLAAGIGTAVVVARQLSPAFKRETDGIMAAIMQLDFGTAWSIMNLNFAIALTQMAQRADAVLGTVKGFFAATGAFIGDKLIEGLDRFMGLFGADIITLQTSLQQLGVYLRAAFDWDFALNGMTAALAKIDADAEKARAKTPTADARATEREKERQAAADRRQQDSQKSQDGWQGTVDELRKDLERAHDGLKPKASAAEAAAATPGGPIPVTGPGGVMMPGAAAAAAGGNVGQTVGTFSSTGAGLGIGPELNKLEDPAKQTAANTAATAIAVQRLAGGPGVGLAAQGLGGSAIAASEAVGNLPGAAARAQAGMNSMSVAGGFEKMMQTNFALLISAVQEHAKISAGHTAKFDKLIENTGKLGGAFV